MTDERGRSRTYSGRRSVTCAELGRGGVCIAAWQSRAAARMPRWSVGERKRWRIVRKVAPERASLSHATGESARLPCGAG